MEFLIEAGAYLLVGMFLTGLAGSSLVAVITFVEDARTLLAAFTED